MEPRRTYPRNAGPIVSEALADTRVVVLHGPRQAGKSTLAARIAAGCPGAEYRTLDSAAVLAAARADPVTFVRGAGLLVLDEVQRAPELLLAVKEEADRDPRPGKFLLTGSSHVLALPRLADSLAGRTEVVPLLPLSQGELRGRREDFIDRVFASSGAVAAREAADRPAVAHAACVGGFPEVVARSDAKRRRRWFDGYIDTLIRRDVIDLAGIERPDVLARLLRTMAARATDLVNFDALARDVRLSPTTLRRYVALLRAVFLVDELPAWETSRTQRAIRTPKLHFVDSGIAAHLLGATPASLAHPVSEVGRLVETFVVAEIRKQVPWSDTRPTMHHYRSKDGAEVDVVLEAPDGRIAGIEIKAGATVTARDFAGLRHVAERAGNRFVAGIVLHTGPKALAFGPELTAVPISSLWD